MLSNVHLVKFPLHNMFCVTLLVLKQVRGSTTNHVIHTIDNGVFHNQFLISLQIWNFATISQLMRLAGLPSLSTTSFLSSSMLTIPFLENNVKTNQCETIRCQPIQSMFTQIACCRHCTLARSERASKSRPTLRSERTGQPHVQSVWAEGHVSSALANGFPY